MFSDVLGEIPLLAAQSLLEVVKADVVYAISVGFVDIVGVFSRVDPTVLSPVGALAEIMLELLPLPLVLLRAKALSM